MPASGCRHFTFSPSKTQGCNKNHCQHMVPHIGYKNIIIWYHIQAIPGIGSGAGLGPFNALASSWHPFSSKPWGFQYFGVLSLGSQKGAAIEMTPPIWTGPTGPSFSISFLHLFAFFFTIFIET